MMARSMARLLRYQVAVSLDGFITDANGGADWIVMDPSIDFRALYAQFDTVLMGRKTYETGVRQMGDVHMPGMDIIVFSSTLPPATRKSVRIVNDDPVAMVRALKAGKGRDIWLFGGGELFRSLLDAGLVDTVEVAVMPVLLGSGTPLLPPGKTTPLSLSDRKILPSSGIVVLAYQVGDRTTNAPRIAYVTPAARAAKRPTKRPTIRKKTAAPRTRKTTRRTSKKR